MVPRKLPPPADLEINVEPRRPERDPELGVPVHRDGDFGDPRHRLVTIGDSITQGFMSGAIFRTDVSWPAVIARELGVRPGFQTATSPGVVNEFRFPIFENPDGPGGLPFDLERAVRGLAHSVGENLSWWELGKALLWARRYMDHIEDYWERGTGSKPPPGRLRYDNVAVFGADLLDVQFLAVEDVTNKIGTPNDDLVSQIVEDNNDRAWQWVLDGCRDATGAGQTVLQAVQAMGDDGVDDGESESGIETLIVMLGSNNALGSVVDLEPRWTQLSYGDLALEQRVAVKGPYNIWDPRHFAQEWESLVGQLRQVKARHVIVCTVPAVTIAPIARGVRGKVSLGSRYFSFYTRPWIDDAHFDERDPHITEQEASRSTRRSMPTTRSSSSPLPMHANMGPIGTCSISPGSSIDSRRGATTSIRARGRCGGHRTSFLRRWRP